jgi:hypothetical protein
MSGLLVEVLGDPHSNQVPHVAWLPKLTASQLTISFS